MPLINWKVELRLKRTKYCVLSTVGADNVNNIDSDNINFTIKDTKLYVSAVTLSARDNQKLSKRLSKESKRSAYWNEYKTKSENKNTTNELRYFLESNFIRVGRLFLSVYSNRDADSKRFKTRKYYLPKDIIKIIIINRKDFYDQPVDSDIKRYEEIRKLTKEQGEYYTTGC